MKIVCFIGKEVVVIVIVFKYVVFCVDNLMIFLGVIFEFIFEIWS